MPKKNRLLKYFCCGARLIHADVTAEEKRPYYYYNKTKSDVNTDALLIKAKEKLQKNCQSKLRTKPYSESIKKSRSDAVVGYYTISNDVKDALRQGSAIDSQYCDDAAPSTGIDLTINLVPNPTTESTVQTPQSDPDTGLMTNISRVGDLVPEVKTSCGPVVTSTGTNEAAYTNSDTDITWLTDEGPIQNTTYSSGVLICSTGLANVSFSKSDCTDVVSTNTESEVNLASSPHIDVSKVANDDSGIRPVNIPDNEELSTTMPDYEVKVVTYTYKRVSEDITRNISSVTFPISENQFVNNTTTEISSIVNQSTDVLCSTNATTQTSSVTDLTTAVSPDANVTNEIPSVTNAISNPSVTNAIGDVSLVTNPTAEVPTVTNAISEVTSVTNATSDVSSVTNPTSEVPSVTNATSDVSSVANPTSDVPSVTNATSDVSSVANPTSEVPSVTHLITGASSVTNPSTLVPSITVPTRQFSSVTDQSVKLKTTSERSPGLNSDPGFRGADIGDVPAAKANVEVQSYAVPDTMVKPVCNTDSPTPSEEKENNPERRKPPTGEDGLSGFVLSGGRVRRIITGHSPTVVFYMR